MGSIIESRLELSMRTRIFWFFCLLLFCIPGIGVSQNMSSGSQASFIVLPSFWFPEMKKSRLLIQDSVGSGPVLGEKVDLANTFGVDDGPEMFPGVRALLGYRGSFYLRLGYQELRFDGNSMATAPIEFAGYTIQANTPVDTSNRFDYFEVGVQYNLINTEDFKLGILAEPKIMNMRLRVSGIGQEGSSGPAVPFCEKEEEVFAIPLVGVSVQLRPFDFLGIRGELKGLRIPNAEHLGMEIEGDVTAVDYEVAASLYFGDSFALTGGYRGLKFDIELEQSSSRNVDVDLEFRGWFAGLDLMF